MVPTTNNQKEKDMLDMTRLSKRARVGMDQVRRDNQGVYNIVRDHLHGRRNTDTIVVAMGMVDAVLRGGQRDAEHHIGKDGAEWQAEQLKAYHYKLSEKDYANLLSAVNQ
jgi:hypothetical protein